MVQIQGCHPEHFSSTFTVASGDQRRMNINKVAFIKKLMDGKRSQGTNTENRLKRIGSGAQVRNGS